MVQRSSTYVMSAEKGARKFLRKFRSSFSGLWMLLKFDLSGLYWGENNLPTDLADRLFSCMPYNFAKYLAMLMTKEIAELDRWGASSGYSKHSRSWPRHSELLDGLRKAGFRLNYGIEGAGALSLIRNRAGGFYIGEYPFPSYFKSFTNCFSLKDVGASQLIIEGKIKIKSGCAVSHFEDHHVVFEDGTKLYADALVFATGWVVCCAKTWR